MPPRRSWLRRLAVLVGIAFALVGVATVLERLSAGRLGIGMGPTVGVVELEGEIRDAEPLCESLETLRKDPQVVAVVLRINSPGGAVAPCQEISEEIVRLREAKPVIASLGSIAASAAYYIAAGTNRIVAAPGTLTGSIGVIMEFRQLQGLAEKVGVGEQIVKSGTYKDIGHPLRSLTDGERTLLQSMVDDVHGQFIDAVAKGRGMERARIKELADGRLFSGAQAKAAGLVDELGGLSTAIQMAWEQGGQTGEPRVRRLRTAWRPWWLDVLGRALSPTRPLGDGLLFLYGGPTPQ